jgi:uncharacterized repeat protein (TIGR03803 family)
MGDKIRLGDNMNSWKTWMSQSSGSKTTCAIVLLCVATAMTCPAQTFTTLANFNKTDGWAPYLGSLVQGTDGNLYGTTELGGGTTIFGTVFRVTPDGTLTSIYSFCSQPRCADGSSPYAGLLLGTDGNFYGATSLGGPNSAGTIFRITSAGVLTTLYSFCSQPACADGNGSYAGLIQGTDGNFYGSAGAYLSPNQGTVFKLTPGGKLTTLHTFTGADGILPGALLQATDGSFYGTTAFGGASSACGGAFMGCGTVFKITSGGTFTTLHNFLGGADGNRPQDGLIQGADGNLYGTTLEGGSHKSSFCSWGCGTVFKISTSGAFTTLHNFDATADGSYPTSPLMLATDGNYYGTASAGGALTLCGLGCGTVFSMTPADALTLLHTFNSTDGATPDAGLMQATNGIFYGTTSSGGNNRACDFSTCGTIFSLDMGLGKFVETVPSSGKTGAKVIILGNNLIGATAVTFNGTPATFKVVSATEITTTVPLGATTGPVRVSKPAGTVSSNVAFRVR